MATTETIGTDARDRATITLWEANLAVGDQIGECYDDSAFDETVTINDTDPDSITLTVAVGERHDGTAGTGARIVATAIENTIVISVSAVVKTVEWLEYDGGGRDPQSGILGGSGPGGQTTVARLLVHNLSGNAPKVGISTGNHLFQLLNCIVYNITCMSGAANNAFGVNVASATRASKALNCTCHGIVNNNGTGSAYNYAFSDDADVTIRNCIGTDPSGDTSGTKQCYQQSAPANAVVDHNLASDTSASGTDSLDSKASIDQFVSNTAPYDLHLKDVAADAFEAGVDLVATPAGVEIDIDGYDRDAEATLWSIGAHDGNNLRGGAPGVDELLAWNPAQSIVQQSPMVAVPY